MAKIAIDMQGKDNASRAFQSASARLAELRREIDQIKSKNIDVTVGDTRNLSRLTAEANRLDRALAGISTTGAQSAASLQGSLGGLKSVLGGLGLNLPTLGAAGLVAAGVGAARAALGLGNLGAQSLTTAKSFDSVLASVGRGPEVLTALQKAASGTVSELRLMQLTNTALAGASAELGGAFADAAPKLLMAARAANQLNPSLGDTEFLFQSLVTGIKRGSPMLIDNTGITLKLGEANEAYAAKLGKSADALTEEEKKVALLNATMAGADRLIQQAGGNLDGLTTSAQQATTAWANLKAAVGEKLAPNVSALESDLANFLNTLTNIVSGKQPEIELRYRVTTDLEDANAQLRTAEAGLAKAAQQGTYLAGTTADWQAEVDKAKIAVVQADLAMQRLNGTLGQTGFDGWSDAGVQAALRVRDAALEASAATAATEAARAASGIADVTAAIENLRGKESATQAQAVAMAVLAGKISLARVEALGLAGAYALIQERSTGLAGALANLSAQQSADKINTVAQGIFSGNIEQSFVDRVGIDVAYAILLDRQRKAAAAAAAEMNRANTGIANDYRSKMSSAIDRASSYMQSEFSAAQQASISLSDQRPGGAGGVNAPGQNGAFEDIFRLQAWLNDGSWQETADKYAIASREQAQSIVANFQAGNITPDVAKLIDTDALAAQARLKTAAEANYAAFAQAIAAKAGTDKTTAQTVLDNAFGVGTAKTGDQTAAQKTGTSAAQALASAFQVEIKGKDFAGQMIGYGETVWGYAEKGIIDKAKTSKAFGAAIKLMVENVLASELEN